MGQPVKLPEFSNEELQQFLTDGTPMLLRGQHVFAVSKGSGDEPMLYIYRKAERQFTQGQDLIAVSKEEYELQYASSK